MENISLEVPFPKSVLNLTLTPSQGKYTFDPVGKILTWDVGRMDPTKLPSIKGNVSLLYNASVWWLLWVMRVRRYYGRVQQCVIYAMLILQNDRFILFTLFVKLKRMSCMVPISVLNMASVYTITCTEWVSILCGSLPTHDAFYSLTILTLCFLLLFYRSVYRVVIQYQSQIPQLM